MLNARLIGRSVPGAVRLCAGCRPRRGREVRGRGDRLRCWWPVLGEMDQAAGPARRFAVCFTRSRSLEQLEQERATLLGHDPGISLGHEHLFDQTDCGTSGGQDHPAPAGASAGEPGSWATRRASLCGPTPRSYVGCQVLRSPPLGPFHLTRTGSGIPRLGADLRGEARPLRPGPLVEVICGLLGRAQAEAGLPHGLTDQILLLVQCPGERGRRSTSKGPSEFSACLLGAAGVTRLQNTSKVIVSGNCDHSALPEPSLE